MLAINNSLVWKMAMVDNISRAMPKSKVTGGRLLETKSISSPPANLAELIRRSQAGQLEAFEQLYNLYIKKVYGLAFNLTHNHQAAEDLSQDIFIKIFSAINDIDQPELFPAWVYRIALNTCYSHLRREKTINRKLEEILPADEGQPDGNFDTTEDDLARWVNKALADLPAKLRSVFLLHEVEGLTHEEIAEVLGCQVGTSKSQLFKARMKLQKILRKKNLLKGAVI